MKIVLNMSNFLDLLNNHLDLYDVNHIPRDIVQVEFVLDADTDTTEVHLRLGER